MARTRGRYDRRRARAYGGGEKITFDVSDIKRRHVYCFGLFGVFCSECETVTFCSIPVLQRGGTIVPVLTTPNATRFRLIRHNLHCERRKSIVRVDPIEQTAGKVARATRERHDARRSVHARCRARRQFVWRGMRDQGGYGEMVFFIKRCMLY